MKVELEKERVRSNNNNSNNQSVEDLPSSLLETTTSTTTDRDSQQDKQVQRRRSKRVLDQDPIIAPGYGTRKDLIRLTRELGNELPLEAVEAIMKSRGRGIRSSSRKSGEEDASTSAPAAPQVDMWADFMQQEGYGATAAKSATGESPTKKAKLTSNNNSNTTTKSQKDLTLEEPVDHKNSDDLANNRQYSLPEEWLEFYHSTMTKKKKASTKSVGGILLQSGTLDTTVVGRLGKQAKGEESYRCAIPTCILPITIAQVFTSCNAVHSFALTADGTTTYGWGRNESNQLTIAGASVVVTPTPISLPAPLRQAAVGKSHSIFLLQDKSLHAVGANKAGQCGVRSFQDVVALKKCLLPEGVVMAQIACGEDYTMAVSTSGHLYSCGCSQYGQLGNGETGEHFISANKLAFANANTLERRKVFCHLPNEKLHTNSDSSGKVVPLEDSDSILIQQVACGKHHTLVVEATVLGNVRSRVFSFGCGDYGCLGHGVQRDEYFPRLIGVVDKLPIGDNVQFSVSAGTHCSLLRTHSSGHVYYWGKHRSVGEAIMRPQLVDVLANNHHIVTHAAAGGQTVVCSTSAAQTVAWGQGPHGELGLGKAKSSAKPTFVESLNNITVLDIAGGYGHTLFVVEESDASQKLPKVEPEDIEPLVPAPK